MPRRPVRQRPLYRRNADESARRRERARAAEPTQEAVDRVVIDKLRAGRPGQITLFELGRVSREVIPDEVLGTAAASAVRIRRAGHLDAWEAVYREEEMSDAAVIGTYLTLQGAARACTGSAMDRIADWFDDDPDWAEEVERLFGEGQFDEPMAMIRARIGIEYRTRKAWIYP